MPKLVAGWVLGTHNFNCKSSSLFTRNKLIFLFSFFLYFISHLLLSSPLPKLGLRSQKQSQRKRTYTTFFLSSPCFARRGRNQCSYPFYLYTSFARKSVGKGRRSRKGRSHLVLILTPSTFALLLHSSPYTTLYSEGAGFSLCCFAYTKCSPAECKDRRGGKKKREKYQDIQKLIPTVKLSIKFYYILYLFYIFIFIKYNLNNNKNFINIFS